MPIATLLAAGLLLGVFALQALTARIPLDALGSPSTADLLAFGGLNPDLVLLLGDWWRLFLAPLLHASALHLALNLAVLLYAGGFVERRLGGLRLAALLALGALSGTLASLAWLPPDRVSIGASGAIMALLACAAALRIDRAHRWRLAAILVLSLIPYEAGVDYAAHIGGALAGAAVALTMRWPVPRTAAGIGALAYAACALFGAVRVAQLSPGFDPDWRVLTPAAAAALERADTAELRRLRRQLPGDPRLALLLARAELRSGQQSAAAVEAREGLRLLRIMADDSVWAGLGAEFRRIIRGRG